MGVEHNAKQAFSALFSVGSLSLQCLADRGQGQDGHDVILRADRVGPKDLSVQRDSSSRGVVAQNNVHLQASSFPASSLQLLASSFYPPAAGTPPADRAWVTPRTIARATASAAAAPSALTSARASPIESANTTSPSNVVCAGEITRAIPAAAITAILCASMRPSPALVATATSTVFGSLKRLRTVPLRIAAAVSANSRESSARRAPPRISPDSGSRMSPKAFTTASAATRTPSGSSSVQQPMPDLVARSIPKSFPTVAPVPAPTLPSATGASAFACAAASAAA